MAVLDRWTRDREGRRQAATFVATLFIEPVNAHMDWLANAATGGDRDHAAWELRYVRRAIGLLAAQTAALNDLTASLVGRELNEWLARDPHVDASTRAIAERQFNVRLSAYRDAVDTHGSTTPIPARVASTLLAFSAGGPVVDAATIARAADMVAGYRAEALTALRDAFGTASLPETVRPSDLVRGDK